MDDSYQISTLEELEEFRDLVNEAKTSKDLF